MIIYFDEGEFWYISTDVSAEEGFIKSLNEGDMIVPQQGWQFIQKWSTIRS